MLGFHWRIQSATNTVHMRILSHWIQSLEQWNYLEIQILRIWHLQTFICHFSIDFLIEHFYWLNCNFFFEVLVSKLNWFQTDTHRQTHNCFSRQYNQYWIVYRRVDECRTLIERTSCLYVYSIVVGMWSGKSDCIYIRICAFGLKHESWCIRFIGNVQRLRNRQLTLSLRYIEW